MRPFRSHIAVIGMALALVAPAPAALADRLTISPIGQNIVAPANSASMTVRADGRGSIPLQFRIVRWTRENGQDSYARTSNVVVSPPAATLRRGDEITVRILRTATTPVRGRECYRIVIDQLPDIGTRGNSIALALRHSLPLCFIERSLN